MIAGEFAVLEPNHHLVVMAVDRFVYTSIMDSETNQLSLLDYQLNDVKWMFNGKKVMIQHADERTAFVENAMTTVLTYLQEQSIEITPFSLTVNSELDDKETGAKYGLGSSAAVVTSVITAILTKFYEKKMTKKLIFKLAAISHVRTQGSGSGADIAASTYGGVLLYSSFQANWLKELISSETSTTKIIDKDWENLSIKKVQLPKELNVCVGWTGKPASTANLVSEISKLKEDEIEAYDTFLAESERAVQSIVTGMTNNDLRPFFEGITKNKYALATLGQTANVEIETEKLHLLSKEAEKFGGVGKLSGAGGGDCGIAFLPQSVNCEELHQSWTELGIVPLQVNIHPYGAELSDE